MRRLRAFLRFIMGGPFGRTRCVSFDSHSLKAVGDEYLGETPGVGEYH